MSTWPRTIQQQYRLRKILKAPSQAGGAQYCIVDAQDREAGTVWREEGPFGKAHWRIRFQPLPERGAAFRSFERLSGLKIWLVREAPKFVEQLLGAGTVTA